VGINRNPGDMQAAIETTQFAPLLAATVVGNIAALSRQIIGVSF
jgi:hypothetical protein